MIYLLSFKLSDARLSDPNIYPYNVFRDKDIDPFVFSDITILYGDNGSGKSTVLNIIAECLDIKGQEKPVSNVLGLVDYCDRFTKIINMRKQWIPVSINNESESSPGRTGKRYGDYDLSV